MSRYFIFSPSVLSTIGKRCFHNTSPLVLGLLDDFLYLPVPHCAYISISIIMKNKETAVHVITYNPSYSGGRDQEDHGSKPPQANNSQDAILEKKPSQKRNGGVA
jgi:hypothetical protein